MRFVIDANNEPAGLPGYRLNKTNDCPVRPAQKPGVVVEPWRRLALASAASLALLACGGGDVDVSLAAAPAPMESLQGVAAVGAALGNSPVKIRCPREKNATYPISATLSKSAALEDSAVFKVTDASNTDQTIFDGQVIRLSTKGSLPKPLNTVENFYVVNKTADGFQLSRTPSGAALSTYGSTQAGLHAATTGKMLEKTVTTGPDGAYAVNFSEDLKVQKPCLLEVSAKEIKLHAVSSGLSGVANITPLTEALLAILVETGDLARYFTEFGESNAAELRQLASAKNIDSAWNKIKAMLASNGIDTSAITTEPISASLSAANALKTGDAHDRLLDKLAFNTASQSPYNFLQGKEKMLTLIKLDSKGLPLKNQFGKWSDAGSEEAGTKWDCVHDTVSNLLWEVKPNLPNHLRHREHQYTWFDSKVVKDKDGKALVFNGGSAGTELSRSCQGFADPAKCNTENYVRAVNETRLCGFEAWGLPDVDSLQKFPFNYAAVGIVNTDYFPDLQSQTLANSSFWTSTSSANSAEGNYAWVVNFGSGKVEDGLKASTQAVRLVLPVNTFAVDISSARPAVFKYVKTAKQSAIANDQVVTLRTNGLLPNTLSQGRTYYVVKANADASSFELSTVKSGESIATLNAGAPQGPHFAVVSLEAAAKTADVGRCHPGIEVSRPDSRYTVSVDEVTDTVTGLKWKRCVEGLSGASCTGTAKPASYKEAQALALSAATTAKPWRLPSRTELAGLIDRKCTGVWKYKVDTNSALYMSQRTFTETGGWEQAAVWSLPTAISNPSANFEFSVDGKTWDSKPTVDKVYVREKSTSSVLKMAGETGYGWRDGVPAEPADQKTSLWMSKRVFTPYGAEPQDAKWSEPEELKVGSKLEFSTNGESWYFPPTGNDVYLRESPTSPKVIMRGEAGTQNEMMTAGSFVTGISYTIQAVGSTDFKLIGAASNLAGLVFTATGPGTGSGTAIKNVPQITGYAFFRGNYTPDDYPTGGSFSSPKPGFKQIGQSGQGMVRGFAFYRGNLPPSAPSGGSFAYPTPGSAGWSDAIPKEVLISATESAASSGRAINQTIFPQNASSSPFAQAVWTATTNPNYPANLTNPDKNSQASWIVNFYNGFLDYVDVSTANIYVWLVRSP